jgi:non-ribosomal peptide synthetase component F
MRSTTVDTLHQSSLFELFELTCRAHGARTAVECGAERWTYDQLHERSAALANALRRAGVQEGQMVVVSSRRSFDLIASILAVMRMGAVFVPVDPFLPKERIRAIIRHLAPACWMVTKEIAPRLPKSKVTQVVTDAEKGLTTGETPEVVRVAPDSLAYIVYTSGSTGEPKGVMVSHRNLMNYLTWAAETYFHDAEASGALLSTSTSFDLSFTAMFGPLLVGQPIVMVPEDDPGQNISDVRKVLESGRKLALVKLTP